MKKLVLVGVLMLVTIMGGIMVGCSDNELAESVEKEVKQSYVQHLAKQGQTVTVDKVVISKYYGTYNGAVAVMFEAMATQTVWDDYIDKVIFRYRDGRTIQIWKNGTFYELQEAYDKKLISRGNLVTISHIQNRVYANPD